MTNLNHLISQEDVAIRFGILENLVSIIFCTHATFEIILTDRAGAPKSTVQGYDRIKINKSI